MPLPDPSARKGRSPMTVRLLAIAALPALLLGVGAAQESAPKPVAPDPAAFGKQIRPVLQQFCVPCHAARKNSGGVDLTAYADAAAVQRDQTTWRKVLTQVHDRHMPPSFAAQPTQEQRDLLTAWIGGTLNGADERLLPRNPGRVLIHRLNRLEYNNTVRDLFGMDTRPADSFPADGGGGGGFDNNADTLFIPPILMERYLSAADEILRAAKPARLFVARPGKGLSRRDAARRVLAHWAILGFRRPVEPAEVDRLLRLYDMATARRESWEAAVRFSLKAVLVSPNFLFRVEHDRPGAEPYPVSDYELASRLSYFLWSSMPDQTLFRLAARGALQKPAVLDAQVRRMLDDPRSRALAESFGGQWLRVRDLATGPQPDPGKFPGYTPALREAIMDEPIEFLHGLMKDDESLLRLVDADYTYANETLARHYGLDGVRGPQVRRVALADRRRGGVLTMAAVLTQTSYPQRTSPVLRGKWVLSELLGAPPPPPPPNAGALSPDDAPREGLTFRQRLEQHRSKPQCASCHSRMDPLGFGLENFDPIGRWRDDIGGVKVDSAGTLTTGEKFTGPAEMKAVLLSRKDDIVRNVTEKMLAYALGRGLEPYDLPAVRRIVAAVQQDDCRAGTLVREIVKSYPFRYRKNL